MSRPSLFLILAVMLLSTSMGRAELTQEDFRQMQTRFQHSEEDGELLRARVQRLEASLAELRAQIGDVRNSAVSSVKEAVSQDQLKKVVEQLRDLDKRRQEDNDKVINQLKRLADLPPPSLPPAPLKPEKNIGKGGKPKGEATSDEGEGAKLVPESKSLLPANYESYEHVIEAGQTLGEIMAQYNKIYSMKVRLKHVLEANPKLNPDRMVPGRKVKIPVIK